jgi:glutamyl-Q tRNA(Asp) synthetase
LQGAAAPPAAKRRRELGDILLIHGTYVGRFAPSPTGPLHLGSLFAAVASFLHARQARGEWLLRIDDIDPPREVPGAADRILRALETYGLHWDREVLYQSSRTEAYVEAVQGLLSDGRAFRCSCSRRELRELQTRNNRYPGTCRDRRRHTGPTAVRVRVDAGEIAFVDGLQGRIATDLSSAVGDYIVYRRDGLPAYHLAAVLDDDWQGVNAVVRGADLLDSTAAQLHLHECLGLSPPRYWHLPVLVDANGDKLSKGSGAESLDAAEPAAAAFSVMRLLGAEPPPGLRGAPPAELWTWAVDRWDIGRLTGIRKIEVGAPAGA